MRVGANECLLHTLRGYMEVNRVFWDR